MVRNFTLHLVSANWKSVVLRKQSLHICIERHIYLFIESSGEWLSYTHCCLKMRISCWVHMLSFWTILMAPRRERIQKTKWTQERLKGMWLFSKKLPPLPGPVLHFCQQTKCFRVEVVWGRRTCWPRGINSLTLPLLCFFLLFPVGLLPLLSSLFEIHLSSSKCQNDLVRKRVVGRALSG